MSRGMSGAGTHYVSLIVNKLTRQIIFYNSIPSDDPFPTQFLTPLRALFGNEINRYEKIIYRDGPVQRDGHNCGLFTILFLEYYIVYEKLLRNFLKDYDKWMKHYRFFVLSIIYTMGYYNFGKPGLLLKRIPIQDSVNLEIDKFKYGLVTKYPSDGFDFKFSDTCKSMYMYVNDCLLRSSNQLEPFMRVRTIKRTRPISENFNNQCYSRILNLVNRKCNDMNVLLLSDSEDYRIEMGQSIYDYDLIIFIEIPRGQLLVPVFFYPRNHLLITYCTELSKERLQFIKRSLQAQIPRNSQVNCIMYDNTNTNPPDSVEENLSTNLTTLACVDQNRYRFRNSEIGAFQLDIYNKTASRSLSETSFHNTQTVIIIDSILTNKSFFEILRNPDPIRIENYAELINSGTSDDFPCLE